MKKLLLILLCVPLMFSNCTNQDQEPQNDVIGTNVFDYGYEKTKIIRTLRNDNNKIIELVKETEIDGKQMRITEEYNNDGVLTYELIFDLEQDEKFRISYYDNGRLKYKGKRKKIDIGNKKVGIWSWWYENGNKKKEGEWYITKIGLWKHWYENGQLAAVINWGDDGYNRSKQPETYECWDEDGNEMECELYE